MDQRHVVSAISFQVLHSMHLDHYFRWVQPGIFTSCAHLCLAFEVLESTPWCLGRKAPALVRCLPYVYPLICRENSWGRSLFWMVALVPLFVGCLDLTLSLAELCTPHTPADKAGIAQPVPTWVNIVQQTQKHRSVFLPPKKSGYTPRSVPIISWPWRGDTFPHVGTNTTICPGKSPEKP